jgi:ABC-type transport system involved in cytochrome bd biosynthesis fused ATPase/permease subunit
MARSLLVRSLPVIALLLAGVVALLVGGDSTLVLAIGVAAIGVALVLLVSLLFYEVGRSEDRARAAERRRDDRP